MLWLQRYRIRHYLGNSIWVLPFLAILTAMASVAILHRIETNMGWKSSVAPGTAVATGNDGLLDVYLHHFLALLWPSNWTARSRLCFDSW
jgi:hypothetical protein